MQAEARKRMIRSLALRRVKAIKTEAAEYLADMDAWYTSGDGRPTYKGGRGYSYPYCFHGTSRWTDYDNICPGCEDGHSPYLTGWMYRVAIDSAKSEFRLFEQRMDWLNQAPSGLPSEIRTQVLDWALDVIK